MIIKKQISIKDPFVIAVLITAAIAISAYLLNQKIILQHSKQKIDKFQTELQHIQLENETAMIYNETCILEEHISPQKDPSWLLTQITELAKQSKFNLASVEPLPARQIPPYTYVTFKIRITCSFNQLVKFIELIESNKYILSIESIRLDSQAKYAAEATKQELEKEATATVEMVIGTIY